MNFLRATLLLLFLYPLTQAPAMAQPQLLFGQVAIGSQGDLEIRSVITATNSGSAVYQGDFSFFTGDGTVWNPVVNGLTIENGLHSVSIAPFETISLTLTGAGIEAGSAILVGTGPPDTAIEGNLTYFFRTDGTLTDGIGVGPSSQIYRSTLPFQDFSSIALALANQDPTPKDVVLKLRRGDGTLEETQNIPLAAHAHSARFLHQIFDTATVTGGRVDIEAEDPIFGTAVTLLEGQISTLPLRPTPVEYDFRGEFSENIVTGKLTLWANGALVQGYLEPREDNGVPWENPEAIPIAGDLTNGELRITFPTSQLEEDPELFGFGANFSFDLEVVEANILSVVLDSEEGLEGEVGTIRLTKVAIP